jgi:hypothetical protein
MIVPFKSRSQMKAAFSGALGPEMKQKAKQWADETPNIKHLPAHARPTTKIYHPGHK